MNQILVVENKKKNRNTSTPIAIKKIIRFFAFAIILFSLCIIGHSSYALYRDSRGNNAENLAKININRVNDTLVVDVQSTYTITKFRYYWESSEETSIPEESTSFQEEIILPNGNSTLTIILEDETGRAVTYTKALFQSAEATYLEILTAQQNLLSAELSEVSDNFQRIQAVINLYSALGGGRD